MRLIVWVVGLCVACIELLVACYAVPDLPLTNKVTYQLSTWQTSERGVTLNFLGILPVTTCVRTNFVGITDERLKSICVYYGLGIETPALTS